MQCFTTEGQLFLKRKVSRNREIHWRVEYYWMLSHYLEQGFLNGSQCEKILKELDLLHDSGKFEDHQAMFNFVLQRCVEKENKDMEVIK